MLKEFYSYIDLLNFLKESSKDFNMEKTFPLNNFNYATNDGKLHFNANFIHFIKDIKEVLGINVVPSRCVEMPLGYRLFVEPKEAPQESNEKEVKAKVKRQPKVKTEE